MLQHISQTVPQHISQTVNPFDMLKHNLRLLNDMPGVYP